MYPSVSTQLKWHESTLYARPHISGVKWAYVSRRDDLWPWIPGLVSAEVDNLPREPERRRDLGAPGLESEPGAVLLKSNLGAIPFRN